VIDFHNHLLAGVDDGATDLEQARVAMGALRDAGVRTVIVTPHLPGSFTERPAEMAEAFGMIDRAFAEFQSMVAEEYPDVGVHRGVELMLDWPTVDLSDPRVRLAATSFVLVEFPGMVVPPRSAQALERLREQGWRPVVAHPERYRNMDDPAIVDDWRSAGAFLQCNAGSVAGRYGTRAEDLVWELLSRGCVDYLCSDYHARGRVPLDACRAAFEEVGGLASFEQLTCINPGRLLEGQEPLPVPPLERRLSLWQRLRRGRA
jgi:protein-tyrosine phosphatase